MRVSQVLSLILAAAAFVVLVVNKRKHPHGREALYVTRKAAAEISPPGEQEEAAEHEP